MNLGVAIDRLGTTGLAAKGFKLDRRLGSTIGLNLRFAVASDGNQTPSVGYPE